MSQQRLGFSVNGILEYITEADKRDEYLRLTLLVNSS